ncbi:Glu-tRNA(Gln) amidotransferase subunit GatD [archaeon]|jgi:glutamyl-tRNA(Gln) amidotransferase subunit D|nr:Glu-tRNA(Gln) amidotransferase subunit GatD [archaeon]MBT7128354.1 Glu-tRNA(Gln) amidotransferase subunit GatD [archaeon]
MKTKTFQPGDLIQLKTKSKTWKGHALQSHDSEIILLKLQSGYNIGIRESEILDAKILEPHQRSVPPAKRPTSEASHQRSVPQKLPNVAFVITGGTISARIDPKSGGTFPTNAKGLLEIAPELKEICNPIIENPFMKLSEDMDPKDWKTIAEICKKHLDDPKISGIIVTHGSDTLHYTGAALSYFLQDLGKPVALTFSQRSIDRASTDANLNLICAAKYATSDIAEVAIIGHETENDSSCIAIQGTKARKMHTSKRSTFKPINSEPIARITRDSFEILKEFNARDDSRKTKLDTKYQNKVTSIKAHPGRDPAIIDFYLQQGYKGLVIETTGLGHTPAKSSEHNWLPKIKKAIEAGMTIIATAQTINGNLNPNVYSAGRDLQKTGIIFSNLTTETALVKLGWVLGHKQWNKSKKMKENL